MRWVLGLLLFAVVGAHAADRTIAHGRFENVGIYEPSVPAQQFVLLLAATASEGDELARSLQRSGALVAVIDTHAAFANFARDDGECVSPDGDLENLSEFHVGNGFGIDNHSSLPTAPEIKRIRETKLVCIYGEEDEDTTCDQYAGTSVRTVMLDGGHHFDGDYEGLAEVIVREAIGLR